MLPIFHLFLFFTTTILFLMTMHDSHYHYWLHTVRCKFHVAPIMSTSPCARLRGNRTWKTSRRDMSDRARVPNIVMFSCRSCGVECGVALRSRVLPAVDAWGNFPHSARPCHISPPFTTAERMARSGAMHSRHSRKYSGSMAPASFRSLGNESASLRGLHMPHCRWEL
jgi:hypothetical protein